MCEFTYIVTDEDGIHARPAGALVNFAKGFAEDITVYKGEKKADAKRLMAVMSLGAKKGDTLRIVVDGDRQVMDKVKAFFEKNF